MNEVYDDARLNLLRLRIALDQMPISDTQTLDTICDHMFEQVLELIDQHEQTVGEP